MPSGPLSFLRVYDQVANVVKSGGKTRRAAKMNTLKDWHPDIEEFIEAKTLEEKKAWALIEQGEHEQAMEHFREALRLNPQLDWARQGIVEAMKARIVHGAGSWRGAMTLHYALAKEYEDLENYPHAFSQLEKGASLRRSHMDHNPQADLDAMEAIAHHFSASYLQTHAPG